MANDPSHEPPVEPAELQDETIDDAILHRLFEDLDALAAIHAVHVKGAPRQRAQNRPVELREAVELLQTGCIRGAQVLYEYDGRSWCDTIIRQPDGYRLTRIEAPRRVAPLVES